MTDPSSQISAALTAARGVARATVFIIRGKRGADGVLEAIARQSGRDVAAYPAIVAFGPGEIAGGALERTSVGRAYAADREDADVLILAAGAAGMSAACLRRPSIDSLEGVPLVLNGSAWGPLSNIPDGVTALGNLRRAFARI